MSVGESTGTTVSTGQLYHEKQQMQLCLMHTLNTLLQRNEFKKVDLDCIAENLHSSRWFNRHRSIFGCGNYDINVLVAALETRNLVVKWFDSRRSTACLDFSKIFGFIFNVTSHGFLPFRRGHHWFTVRQIGVRFFNFDSKLNEPVPINDFVAFSDSLLAKEAQLIVVVEPQNASRYLLSSKCLV